MHVSAEKYSFQWQDHAGSCALTDTVNAAVLTIAEVFAVSLEAVPSAHLALEPQKPVHTMILSEQANDYSMSTQKSF